MTGEGATPRAVIARSEATRQSRLFQQLQLLRLLHPALAGFAMTAFLTFYGTIKYDNLKVLPYKKRADLFLGLPQLSPCLTKDEIAGCSDCFIGFI